MIPPLDARCVGRVCRAFRSSFARPQTHGLTYIAALTLSRLSIILITKNEASNIEACLRSVAFADEIVVVDSGSTDETVEIARRLGARVEVTPDWPGFGPQKNRALALASHPWVLSLDADERVTPELQVEIEAVVRQDGATQAWEIPRLTQFCGQWIHHCGWTPDYVMRLFRRESAQFSQDLVHERLLLAPGQTGRLRSRLLHYSFPTPTHYLRKLEQYSQAWALQRYQAGQRAGVFRATAAAVVAFVRSYFFRLGFLDGAMGFAVCALQAQGAFGKYFVLYCMGRISATKNSLDTGPKDGR
ncbi:MAG: glycosyltransferase family 2 protein [Curvibacter sp.]|jgi:glycosyltransferase involved in cell wall biosynthesis|nr:glycosyltransferase family 2 protein [Curvibacter sp.]